ncbi:MAG: hypothetical protein ACM3X9_01590 [Bacillota bacterium]
MFGKKASGLLIAVLLFNIGGTALAGSFTSQTVDFNVQAINEIATSGAPVIKKIATTVANAQTFNVISAIATYAITTNETGKKITGYLKSGLPEDASLLIMLEAPANATSVGNVKLTSTPSDLVTGVTKVAESGKLITYQFTAPATRHMDANIPDVVVLTITN